VPRGRTKGDHDSKREQIAEAACKVFLRRGLTRTSLGDIAREMGNSTGILRHYFADKEDLLLYVKNLLLDRLREKATLVAIGYDGLAKLRAIAIELLPSDSESIDGFRLLAMFNGSAIGVSRLMKLQHRRNERHIADLSVVIAALQSERVIADDLDATVEASSILALIDGMGEQQIMRPVPWTRATLTSLMNRYIDGLAKPKRSRRRA
jgi:AcrR family transcriptional regulator